MKKAVIFDMDGVLIESEHYYFNRRMKFFDEMKMEPPTRRIQDFIGLTNDMIWEVLVPEDEQKRKALRDKYVQFSKSHEICFTEVLNPAVKELFRSLKDRNIKIAIASSSGTRDISRMLEQCELHGYIDFAISGEECTHSKPSPEIYIKAVKALEVPEAEVLAVEDSELGIRAAKAAGLTVAALVPKEYHADQSEADFQIEDLSEIIEKI